MAIAGLRGTGDFAKDERPENFREYILFRNPNGTSPIFALMSKISSESTDDPVFHWWDEPMDIVRLVTSATVSTTTTTSITVSGTDPSPTAITAVYGSALNLVPGDVLQVELAGTAFTTTAVQELLLVTGVVSATSFTVQRGFANTTPAAIASGAGLTKIGSAFSEGSGAPRSASRNPIPYENYCQIFKTTYELTNTTKKTKFRTGDPLKNDKKRKSFDHSRDIEQAILWGRKDATTGANGKPLRTMGGMLEYIPSTRKTIFAGTSAALTTSTFLDAVYPVFDYDTPAGDTRIAFCGNGALNTLNKMIQGSTNTQINYDSQVKLYGMNLRTYVLPQGTLYLRTHPLFNRHPEYTNSMLILDMSSFRWRHLRDTTFKDNVQGNDEDTQKGQWLTEAGLEVRYGGVTNAFLHNITAASL